MTVSFKVLLVSRAQYWRKQLRKRLGRHGIGTVASLINRHRLYPCSARGHAVKYPVYRAFYDMTLMHASAQRNDPSCMHACSSTGRSASSPAFSRRGHSDRPGLTGSGFANSQPISASLDDAEFGFDSMTSAGAALSQLRRNVGTKLEQCLDTPTAHHPTLGL
eukprot:TRINITY_DN12616_c0_g5_i4.p1 TRINITY_DN12616_c0_g5~~TRINITY_DN12616_c0_g5_i4.p1  ORF type:complete len:163 (+),score=2.78 TRINITY_DN12616_c0_g5_i4:398-886(+)